MVAGLLVSPPIFYILYRAIVPYERAMPDFRLAGSLFFPAIAGFALGLAHAAMDGELLNGGWGGLSFLLLYPMIETYAVIVIFNRNFFYKQPGTPIYFAVGGAGLALGIAFVVLVRSLALPGVELSNLGFLLSMVGLAAAFVLFHSSKALIIGTFFAEGSRVRGAVYSVLVEVPFGALYLGGLIGADLAEVVELMLAYSALMYYMTWHRFFPDRMPEALRKALDKERKRLRRVVIAKQRK